MAGRTQSARITVKVDVTDVAVERVGVQRPIDVGERASLVRVLVAMRVPMCAAVTVRVRVHCVGVVVVSGLIRVGNISVILIPRVCVIAMAAV